MGGFVFILACLLIGLLFPATGLLLIVSRWFGLREIRYKTLLWLNIFLNLFILCLQTVLLVIFRNPNGIGQILVLICSGYIFYLLYSKYYSATLKKSLLIFITYTILFSIFSIASLFVIRNFIVSPFYVRGLAMEPTLKEGQYFMIKLYDKDYQRGDVVVFKYPEDTSQYFVQRIIGLPGENVQIDGESVLINGQRDVSLSSANTWGDTHILLSSVDYFVLGDNRALSRDSRVFGALRKDLIVGKFWFSVGFWPSFLRPN